MPWSVATYVDSQKKFDAPRRPTDNDPLRPTAVNTVTHIDTLYIGAPGPPLKGWTRPLRRKQPV